MVRVEGYFISCTSRKLERRSDHKATGIVMIACECVRFKAAARECEMDLKCVTLTPKYVRLDRSDLVSTSTTSFLRRSIKVVLYVHSYYKTR